MDDPELDAIRAKRMAELQAQHGGSFSKEQTQAREEQVKQQEAMRQSILLQILSGSARERRKFRNIIS